jgi:hypothetical protein
MMQRTGAEIFLLQLNLLPAADLERYACCEVDAFYWTVLAPDIVNPGREEQGSFSV